MGAPVITIDETNGATPGETENLSGVVFASIDLPSSTPNLGSDYPILNGTNSFEKWLHARVATPATNTLSNFQVVFSSTAVTDSNNVATTVPILCGGNVSSYPLVGPVNTASAYATQPCTGQTIGLVAPLNVTGSYTPYLVMQMQVGSGAVGGDAIFPSPFLTLDYTWS